MKRNEMKQVLNGGRNGV